MNTKMGIEQRLTALRKDYSSVYSLLSMMEKGTKLEDLVKLRKEKLDPIKAEINRLEGLLQNSV